MVAGGGGAPPPPPPPLEHPAEREMRSSPARTRRVRRVDGDGVGPAQSADRARYDIETSGIMIDTRYGPALGANPQSAGERAPLPGIPDRPRGRQTLTAAEYAPKIRPLQNVRTVAALRPPSGDWSPASFPRFAVPPSPPASPPKEGRLEAGSREVHVLPLRSDSHTTEAPRWKIPRRWKRRPSRSRSGFSRGR